MTSAPMPGPVHDGSSQASRRRPELDPARAVLDCRTAADDLAFARAFAAGLVYADPDGAERGDWQAMFPAVEALTDAADYLRRPETFGVEAAAPFERPHFALLLAFVDLLGLARRQLNALSRSHLDHFYREVLRLAPAPAVADQLHLLLRPDPRQARVPVPAGTLMRAAKDARGRERLFRTCADLVASRVQLAALCSLRTHVRSTGIAEASAQYRTRGTRQQAFLAMLRIALGSPQPGDALPVPILPGLPAATGGGPAVVDFDTVVAAQQIVGFVGSGLWMPMFDEFRRLMQLGRQRLQDDAGDWARINALLEQAGRRRDPAFAFKPGATFRADDFHANLRAALGLTPAAYAKLYDTLPEVVSVEDAHARLARRPDVQDFVQTRLRLTLDEFQRLMQTKLLLDGQWREIVALIEAAGRRRDPALVFDPAQRGLRDVDQLLAAALGPLAWPAPVSGGLAGLHQAFEAIEAYFGMSAERLHYIVEVARRSLARPATEAADSPTDAADWAKVHALCAEAYRVVTVRRRQALMQRAAAPAIAAGAPSSAMAAMLSLAVGAPVGADNMAGRLAGLGLADDDLAWLQALAGRGAQALPAAADWQRAAELLEVAQRNREGLVLAAPVQRLWHHAYAAMDARQVRVPGQPADEAAPRWKPFGGLDAAFQRLPTPPEVLGWALCSPLLALAEGQRDITLRLGFDGDPARFDPQALAQLLAPDARTPRLAGYNPFHVQFSGPEGWIDADSVNLAWNDAAMGGYPKVDGVDTRGLRMLVLSCSLGLQQAAVVPPSLALHGLAADQPAIRLRLRPQWSEALDCHHSAYQALAGLLLQRLQLQVQVTGLASLALQNDQSVLDPKQPFEPFGSSPASGARLSIGHPELVGKTLDSISFRASWMGVPASLAAHYRNYPSALTANSFSARIGLRDGLAFAAAAAPLPLFGGADTAGSVVLSPPLPAEPGRLLADPPPAREVAAWRRCWVWELAGDFQHPVYPAQALKLSMQMAAAVAAGQKPAADSFLLNPPYTPKLKSLVVDYRASAEQTAVAGPGTAQAGQLHHVLPFGHLPLEPASGWPVAGPVPLLPASDAEGELYIGLGGVAAPQRLSLLVQVAEGSADPDAPPEPVHWSVLDGNRWRSLQSGPLEGSLLADGTRGLVNPGIVELLLPAAAPCSVMALAQPLDGKPQPPGGLYWLRLQRVRAIAGVGDLVALHPHAVLAERVDAAAGGDDLAQPLPPGQVGGPLAPVPGLVAVQQPYSSFGGRPAEQPSHFDTRVSERLRHRQRALTPWDVEHLVLERFPQLYKAKCLRAEAGSADGPGCLRLVVVPDVSRRHPCDPFAPRASAELIQDIQAWLADKLPAAARLKVINAHFVALKVRCGVRFIAGSDEGWCRSRLGDELNRFLSPWAFESGADLVIGGSIYANSIINFIEQRPYVDYIAGLRLFTGEGGRFTLVPEAPEHRAATHRPDAVLVTAGTHEFDVIAGNDYRAQAFGGIGHMRIELDFSVA